jgi:hypothetical protein
MPKARSTMRASPRMSPVRLKIAACPFAQSAHDFETFDRRIGCFQRFEPSYRFDQLLQLAVIGLNNVVQILDLSVHEFYGTSVFGFQLRNSDAISR